MDLIDKIGKFVSFTPRDMDLKCWLVIAFTWVLVLGCTVWSVFDSHLNRRQRMVWLTAVFLLPLVGLAGYVVRSLLNRPKGESGYY